MYGFDPILPKLEKPSDAKNSNNLGNQLPSNLDEVDSFLSKATSEQPIPSIQMKEETIPGLEKKKSSRLRQKNEPFNSVSACEVNETSPQRGEVLVIPF